jgi:flavodoxin
MKTAIIYFSYDGNTAMIAEMLKKCLQADVLELHLADETHRKGLVKLLWGGRQVLFHETPALKPYSISIEQYDVVIIGTPVWAGSPSPPIHAFLEKTKITGKKVALYCCHAGGKGKTMEKLRDMVSGNTIIGELDLVNPKSQPTSAVNAKINEWIKILPINQG